MSGLRKIIAAAHIGLLAAVQALPAQAGSRDPLGLSLDPLAREFAYCAGRLSATMEHQWLMIDPAADRTKAQRAAMISLLEAVTPPAQARDTLHLRISAKMAHARLLTLATYTPDEEIAARAQTRADTALGSCLSMLLG